MSAAGTDIQATLINCFVQPVGDCIQGVDDEGYPGIYEALREAAETMRRGGGVGYDFSRIRPRGADVKGTASMASGPCSYINVFDQSCSTVESAGARRGAQMGVLRIDHPDVQEFITAKRTPGRWNNFNVSVGVTRCLHAGRGQTTALGAGAPGQARRQALMAKGAYQRADGQWVYQTLPARELWDTIMSPPTTLPSPASCSWTTSTRTTTCATARTIAATNPCGEQPLPSYGCCDLGPIILTRFVRHPFGFGGDAVVRLSRPSTKSVAMQVRALDNVLDVTFWPLPQQRDESAAKRRIGVGFTGMGNTLAMLCLRYDRAEGRAMAARIASACAMQPTPLRWRWRRRRARSPSSTPTATWPQGTFASRLPAACKAAIRTARHPQQPPAVHRAHRHGEPGLCRQRLQRHRAAVLLDVQAQEARGRWQHQRVRGGRPRLAPVPRAGRRCEQAARRTLSRRWRCRPTSHIAMMEAVQPFVDTAISKTVNVPADYPYDDFKDLYQQAWRARLKGLATYRPNAILGSVLDTHAAPEAAPAATPPAPLVDPMRTVIESRPKGALSAVAEKIEYWTQEGHKTLYLVVSFLPVPTGDGQWHGGPRHRVLHARGPKRRVAAVDHLQHAHAVAGRARRLSGAAL